MLWLLIGCFQTVETPAEFAERYAEIQCRVYKECYRMYFDGEYGLMDECIDSERQIFATNNADIFGGCAFNAEQANECLVQKDTATCGELWEDQDQINMDCNENVWTCEESG